MLPISPKKVTAQQYDNLLSPERASRKKINWFCVKVRRLETVVIKAMAMRLKFMSPTKYLRRELERDSDNIPSSIPKKKLCNCRLRGFTTESEESVFEKDSKSGSCAFQNAAIEADPELR